MTDKDAKFRFDRDRARDILKEFINKPNVYPSVHYPEYTYDSLHSLTSLFDYPYVVWLPETHNISHRVFCINPGCKCTPSVKGYHFRIVEDLNHRTVLLYMSYLCNDSRRSFNTVTPEYFKRNPTHALLMPYYLSHKHGISMDVFDSLHESMMGRGKLSANCIIQCMLT